jgi:hypothetical protein
MKRPPERLCKVQALMAVTAGLRGKAIATAVPIPTFLVAFAAKAITT